MEMRGVYQIRCLANGKIYVGGSDNLVLRWTDHQKQLKYGTHPAKRLLVDFWKYGLDKFVFEVLEAVEDGGDVRVVEQKYLDALKPYDRAIGYNSHTDARGPTGMKRTIKHRRKIAAALKGQSFGEERCTAISEGRKASTKARDAMRDLNISKRFLSDDEAIRIVELRKSGMTVIAIATQFGVTRRPIQAILSGETYSDATGIPKPPC